MLSWLRGWISAWPKPALKVEQQSDAIVLSHAPKRAQATTRISIELMSLPEELLAVVTMKILLVDTKGSRWARTCKAFNEHFVVAHEQLSHDGIAWWTGNGEPHRPPPLLEVPVEQEVSLLKCSDLVYGMDHKDIARIHSGWLTNFSIDAILVTMDCPIIIPHGAYVAQPVNGALVLSAQLSGLCMPRTMMEFPMGFPATSFWGRADVCAQIRAASCINIPLNVDNNHWRRHRRWSPSWPCPRRFWERW